MGKIIGWLPWYLFIIFCGLRISRLNKSSQSWVSYITHRLILISATALAYKYHPLNPKIFLCNQKNDPTLLLFLFTFTASLHLTLHLLSLSP